MPSGPNGHGPILGVVEDWAPPVVREPERWGGEPEIEPNMPGFDDLPRGAREYVVKALDREKGDAFLRAYKARLSPGTPVDVGTLNEVLARPPEPPERVAGLLPTGGRLLLCAQRKTGKTTWLLNLAASLLKGEPFLGTLTVRPADGRIALLNYEVSGQQIARWAHEVGVPGDRMLLVNLRGSRNLLATPEGRAELVTLLKARNVQVLMVDPFGRAFTGKSQNDAGEVGPWLVALDEVASEAGVQEVVLTTHAGWEGEHARGSSALEDWPDSIVWLVRDTEGAQRFMRAEGRDVLMEEDRLIFEPLTRCLVLSGDGDRKKSAEAVRARRLVPALVATVKESPGIGVRGIADAWTESGVQFRKGDVQAASRKAVEGGLVEVRTGPRGAKEHFPK